MKDTNQEVRQRLLLAGKEEFLAHGFAGASLRKICSSAGVTTGALYFFFANKEDLFHEIVREPMEIFSRMYEQLTQREMLNLATAEENEDRIICMLMRYREECLLVLDKAEGTRYADFRESYTRRLEETFLQFFDHFAPGHGQEPLVRMLARMRLCGYLQVIEQNPPLEEARNIVKEMACYADAGFQALIQKWNKG